MKRKIFSILFALVLAVSLMLMPAAVLADPGTLYVDDDYTPATLGWGVTHFCHPQDAVNKASPGDTILVNPGTYGSRGPYIIKPPHWTYPNDQLAPALIVWKAGLTIKAVDPDPANTTIESTHTCWSNPVAIQASTGGIWSGSAYVGAGVYPGDGTAPSAVIIVADDVTIDGFTIRRPYFPAAPGGLNGHFYNTAGVFIGGLYAGDMQFHSVSDGVDGATVQNCVFKDVWHGVYIWHSSGNLILKNIVEPLGSVTTHWAGISIYDGYNDAQINSGHTSKYNRIVNNWVKDKGIAVGAWAPNVWADNAGTIVRCNTATQFGVTYSTGLKIFCNKGLHWQVNTQDAVRLVWDGYTTPQIWPNVTFSAKLAPIPGSTVTADLSGQKVLFDIYAAGSSPVWVMTLEALTDSQGKVSVTTDQLGPDIYYVDLCLYYKGCLADYGRTLTVYVAEGGFVTGGGWFHALKEASDPAYVLDGGLAQFGFIAKQSSDPGAKAKGNLEFQYDDPTKNINLHGDEIQWVSVASTTSMFKGAGYIKDYPNQVTFKVMVKDFGEPGVGVDEFDITIWDGYWLNNDELPSTEPLYRAKNVLEGGNIIIHKQK